LKWVLAAVAAIVVLTIAAMAALPRIVYSARVQSLIASTASHAVARPVKFQSVTISVLPYPALRLNDFEVGEDPAFGAGPFVRLDGAYLRLKLWPLLRGRLEFATLVLKRPTISLLRTPDGRWNFASLGPARETAAASRATRGVGVTGASAAFVSGIVIEQGLVTYEIPLAGRTVRHRIEDAEATLVPTPGAITFTGSGRLVPGDLRVKMVGGTVGFSGVRTLGEASVRGRVELDGKDVQPVVATALGPEPAIGGAVTGRIDISGTVGRPRAVGEIELRGPNVTRTSAACPEPRRRTLALGTVKANVVFADNRLVVQPFTTGIGSGSVAARLTASPVPSTHAQVSDLVLKAMPLAPVLVDFLCQGYAVTGQLDLSGTLTLSPADPVRTLSGSGRFHVGPGKVVGPQALALLNGFARLGGTVSSLISLDVPAALTASPFEFESITGTYEIRNGVVTTRDLVYRSRAMHAKVGGEYDIVTDRVNLNLTLEQGRGVLQAKISHTAADPSIRVISPSLPRVDTDRVEHGFKDLLKKFR
jgi:uncharacterized protein involved in outer membrane biogenesis